MASDTGGECKRDCPRALVRGECVTRFREIGETQRRLFIEVLGECCNVRHAAAVAGFAHSAAYKLRRVDRDFADAWQAALESGYARLEMALVERAIDTIEKLNGDDDGTPLPPVGAMTVAQAMDVMAKHRASVEGGRAKRVRLNIHARPSAEDTDAEILRRIAIIEAQRAAPKGKER
jgi:hypothetical protein